MQAGPESLDGAPQNEIMSSRASVAPVNEIGHRTGPRKKRTLYIADAKQATGQLITEIQIGQRMLGIIESSARYVQAMERWRQRHADDSSRMMMDRNGTPPPHPHPQHPT